MVTEALIEATHQRHLHGHRGGWLGIHHLSRQCHVQIIESIVEGP